MDGFLKRAAWLNPPPSCSLEAQAESLTIATAANTDFWQRTHYGFRADNGHFPSAAAEGDFLLTARVEYWPVHQYDQAGLMVRISPDCWLKTSVECEPEGPARLGAVVTNHGYSDWSTQPHAPGPGSLYLRIRREGPDYTVESSPDGSAWTQIRLARLLEDQGQPVLAGLYACSPKGAGFRAAFTRVAFLPVKPE